MCHVGLLATAVALAVAGPAPAATSAQRDAAVRWAVAQAGTHERGTSNCAPAIDRWMRHMGLRTRPCRPWCGAYVHEAFLRAGIDLSARLIDPARIYADAVAHRRGFRAIPRSDVGPGDLLLFAFDPRKRASHIAIVRSRPRGGSVRTAEGNVSHAVRLKTRGLRYAVLAVRVTS